MKIWLVIDGFIHPLEKYIDGKVLGIAKSLEEIEKYKTKYANEIKYLDFYEIEI